MTHGRIFARFAFVNGRTRLVEHTQQAPLKIARAFEIEDGGLEICVMDASPGLLSGDQYEMEWHIESGARVRVVTQGATRIHPSIGSPSRQNVRIHVGKNAHFEWWPETTIPFSQSHFQSSIDAHLETGASLLLLEGLSAGRIARGEVFAFHSVRTQIHIHDARGPLFYSRNRFVPQEQALSHFAVWGQALQWTTLLCIGMEADKLSALESSEILAHHHLHGASSHLSRGGIAFSLLGRRASDTMRAALDLRHCIKHHREAHLSPCFT